MCDFWQRMETDQGDLGDIVRASGRAGVEGVDIPVTDYWQVPLEPVSFPPATDGLTGEFSDPFSNIRGPLLGELVGSPTFFDGSDPMSGPVGLGSDGGSADSGSSGGGSSGGLLAQKMFSEEARRPCNIFSRLLQISPGTMKASPLSPGAIKPSLIISGSAGCPLDHAGMQISSPRTPGIKRRKSQAKKVVCIPAPAPAQASSRPSGEVVPSDLWAWRKYGQKPIKGSPYPRGYYRCSSSKGCSARKQVERSRTDPNMLVITYTSEHNHPWPTQRNALAGSTRAQPSKINSSSSSAPKTSSSHNHRHPATLKEEPDKEPPPPPATVNTAATIVKDEAEEAETAMEVTAGSEFDPAVFHHHHQTSYRPMIPEPNHAEDFFADLAELEADPMSLIFTSGGTAIGDDNNNNNNKKLDHEERDHNKAMDPFNMFDWSGNSLFGEAKKEFIARP